MSDIILSKDILETVRIKDHTGKVLSEFSFNPSDANIVDRYDEFINNFESLRDEIVAYEESSEKIGDYDKEREKLHLINRKIHEAINRLVNANVSDSIFSVMGALSPLPSGDYYFTFIVEQIGQKIQNATGARMEKMDMKNRKHTAKYHR